MFKYILYCTCFTISANGSTLGAGQDYDGCFSFICVSNRRNVGEILTLYGI